MNSRDKLRFDEKIIITPSCWIWKASKTQGGYGQFSLNGKSIRAHRYSYLHHIGPIPDGMLVLHRCDTPLCVNPDHLFLGTSFDNAADRDAKGRGNPPVGERAQAAILNENQVRAIFYDERKFADIAKDYGVGRVAVSNIKSGRRWAHLNLGENRGSRYSRRP